MNEKRCVIIEENQYSKKHDLPSEQFMTEVKKRLAQMQANRAPVTLVSLDFDNFNYINDLFSYGIGDRVLEEIGSRIDSSLGENDLFCKLHADHFLICLQTDDLSLASRVFMEATELKQVLEGLLPQHYTLAASGGILAVQDDTVPLPALLDQVNCARKLSKGSAVNSFHIYDEKMNDDAQWKKQVTCMMEAALNNREFEMYLQPKVILKTGEIMGAEALVRWDSAEYGMIYPDRFIPILEQNGFIRRLDFFMLEEACRFLCENRQKGFPMLPISVNFSKSHLRTEKLVERIFQTVNREGIPTDLIEIEFTETTLSENTERLIEIVTDLKLLGFHVALDDFGSAYSSLNYLKDLPIDIVKVDKGFLDSTADTDRGKIVLAKVVELIKSLRMLSVMEGVETEEQVEFLQKLSCDIGQGYFYAKPMSQSDYLNYLKSGSLMEDLQDYIKQNESEQPDKSYLNVIPQEFQMDNWELYTLGKNIDMGLMKGYLDGESTVQYVNDRALEYLGYTRQEFREIFHNSIVAFTHPEDVEIVQKNAELLVTTGKPLEFQMRAIRKDGKIIVLHGRASCVVDERGRPVGIYAFQDVTEELERTAALQQALEDKIGELEKVVAVEKSSREALQLSEERYRIVLEQSDVIMFEWDFATDRVTFSDKYQEVFGSAPYVTRNVSVDRELRGYIHPEDLDAFEKWIKTTYGQTGHSSTIFRLMDIKGRYLRMALNSNAVCDHLGRPVRAIGAFQHLPE